MIIFRNLVQRECFCCPNCIKNASTGHYFEVGTIQLWVLWTVLFQRGIGGSNERGGAGQFGRKLNGDSISALCCYAPNVKWEISDFFRGGLHLHVRKISTMSVTLFMFFLHRYPIFCMATNG